ncbi:MAG: diguanylate cyclase [Burkholderiaceae bacterium]|nr:diguanylate cyclase [Burkholderiaceae bacterium]
MHILLANNSYATECSVLAFLQQEGYRVTYVQDGHAAVDAYLAEPPDLALMDMLMPEMDGIEATRRIKALSGAKWMPVILMTPLLDKNEILAGFDAGADDYLIKPIIFEALDLRMRSMQRIATFMQNNLFGVLDNAHEAILAIDEAGIIQYYNKAMEQIFGYNAAEVIGANVKMLMASPDAEEHDSHLAHYVRERAQHFGIGRKVRGQRKNGEVFLMRLSVTDLRCNTGSQFVGLVIDLSNDEAARQRIEFLALHDSLTGLPNQACFKEALGAGCARSHEQPGAVLFIDLDGFKLINDSHGHAIGDLALITVAKRLRHNLAERDMVARLGGDEFVVLLDGPENATQGISVAQRLLDVIKRPMTLLGNACHLCASIGIALMPAHGVTTNTVLSMADSAMYDAKRAGKGRIVVAGGKGIPTGADAHHAGQPKRDVS